MRIPWRIFLLSLAGGVLGVILTLLAVHLWQDHAKLHFLDQQLSLLIQALNKQKLLGP